MLPVRSLSMALAGTDLVHHRDFVRGAELYRRDIQRMMNADIAQNAKPGTAYVAGPELWAKVPEFDYELPGAAWALERNHISLLLLVAWCAVAVWFAFHATRQLTVD
jgi:ABC-2 type transport system permease protein